MLLDGLCTPIQTILGSQDSKRVQVPHFPPMKKKTEISRKDWKYMEQNPYGDPDFSEEHNRKVIAEVDEWNDMMDRQRERDHKEKLSERTEAMAQYLKNVSDGKGVTSVEGYFGKRYLAYLRGEEIVKQLKANPALVEKLKNRMVNKGKLSPL